MGLIDKIWAEEVVLIQHSSGPRLYLRCQRVDLVSIGTEVHHGIFPNGSVNRTEDLEGEEIHIVIIAGVLPSLFFSLLWRFTYYSIKQRILVWLLIFKTIKI